MAHQLATNARYKTPGPAPLLLIVVIAAGCGPAERSGPAVFCERATELGVDYVHFNGMAGDLYMIEISGPGGGLVDLDNDGDLDVYLPQGTALGPERTAEDALFPPSHPLPLSDRLYRNDLVVDADGERSLSFTDVTGDLSPHGRGYGFGVAAGDYDNDGWVDLYVTNLGENQLLHNDGDGTFSDVTAASGAGDDRWSMPAAFLDYDRDGWLDLYVGNYLVFDFAARQLCEAPDGTQDYCLPGRYPPAQDRLLRNRGDGTFEDVTDRAGLGVGFGPALGIAAADFDGDGWIDIYVANDAAPNNLWMNAGDGTFVDAALIAGCAVNEAGVAESSMGVDAEDFDADGDVDLVMGHLTLQTNTLFRNDGDGMFDDFSDETNIGKPSAPYTTFGTGWIDYDNDGWLDLLTVNGAVTRLHSLFRDSAAGPFVQLTSSASPSSAPDPLGQPNQLSRNLGDGRFLSVTAQAGSAFAGSDVSRGAAFGDVDNDGDTDVLVVNNNGPARLLINEVGQDRSWLGLRLVAGNPPRDRLGARAGLIRSGRPTLWRRVRSEGSFCSASDPRVLFGLGTEPAYDAVRVEWPDGTAEEWFDLPIGRYSTLHKGTGVH